MRGESKERTERMNKATKATGKRIKAYKATISGSISTPRLGEYADFSNIVGYLPFLDDELYITQHVERRYAPMWISLSNDGNHGRRVRKVREFYIDDLEATERTFTFIGKSIKDLSQEEIQDVATLKRLLAVPLYKKVGLHKARIMTYVDYSKAIGNNIDENIVGVQGLSVNNLPDIIVDGVAISEDNCWNRINANNTAKDSMPRWQLELLAEQRSILFDHKTSDSRLKEMIFK